MADSDDRTYIKVHDGMPDHPKVDGLSDKAFRVFVEAVCALSAGVSVPARGRGMAELVSAGLLIPAPQGLALGDVEDIVLGFGLTRHRRLAIPNNVRIAVYERDGWTCLHCGTEDGLSLDHIHPWSLGGSDDFENLQTLCVSCNSRKGARV